MSDLEQIRKLILLKGIISIAVESSRDFGFGFRCSVQFQKDRTVGKQNFKAETFDRLVMDVKNFIESLPNQNQPLCQSQQPSSVAQSAG